MKKLSFILALIIVLPLVFLSCAENGKEPAATTLGTTDVEVTTVPPTIEITQPDSTTEAPKPVPPEPQNPEMIRLGMSQSEIWDLYYEMTPSQGYTLCELYVFWIDENGNNAVAEFEDLNGDFVIGRIDRYFPVFPTKETFEYIVASENITVQELVEIAGIPIKYDSIYNVLIYRDTSLNEHWILRGRLNHDEHVTINNTQRGIDRLMTALSNEYSLKDFEPHRIFVSEAEDGQHKITLQGTYGAEKSFWSRSFDITKARFDYLSNYRNVKDGVLYNAVKTEEYGTLWYDFPYNLFFEIAIYVEKE